MSGWPQPARALYGAGLRALYSRRGLPWMVNGDSIRIDPRVRHLVPHESEVHLAGFIRQQLRPGEIVFDIGSFVGIHAIVAARSIGRSGRVTAFEPTAWSAAIARRHFAYNNLDDRRVQLIEAAVSDKPGRAALHEYTEPYVNSLAVAVDTAATATCREVDVVTIDDTCRRLRVSPSFIRIDVQGAEVHVLRGARETIRAASSALTIVVEMHPQCWPAFGVDDRAMRDLIAELGMDARALEPGRGVFERDAHVVLRKMNGATA